jgi:carnitine 3-dehydrogenase
MTSNRPIQRIAIVGTGVIGASWAAEFLARGFDVVATDPAPNAEANLRKYVDAAWPALTAMGLSPKASRERLTFTLDMKAAVSQADLVQENGPERPDFKIKLFADIDAATPSESIIASSSSGITMSVMQSACKHPERCVIGHPFNPPHMIPLVEVVGGDKTSPETVRRAIDFYASIGKKPIHLGVLDVADADTAVCWGPGLRWGVMGPNMLFHLGGGAGGIRHFMDHLSGPLASWWKDLGSFGEWPEGSQQTIIEGVLKEADGRTLDQLAETRDDVLLGLRQLRAKYTEAASALAK